VSSPDLDDLRLLLAHAHTPPKAGFFRRALWRLRTKLSPPNTRPIAFPPSMENQREAGSINQNRTDKQSGTRDVA